MTPYLIILFAILQLLDAALTVAVLRRGGRELNPVMRQAFDLVGVIPALLILKLGLVALVWWAVTDWRFLAAFDAGYAGLCVWNAYQLIKQINKAKP